jgi:hypothetical protein
MTLAAAPAHRSAWATSHKILDLRLECWDAVPLAPIVLFEFFVTTYYLEFRRFTKDADGVLRG